MANKWLVVTAVSAVVALVALVSLRSRPTEAEPQKPEAVKLEPAISRTGAYRILLAPPASGALVGTTQNWTVRVEDRQGAPKQGCQVSFDGSMPEHGHGLPTAPRVTREIEPGTYLIEGVRLSMPGYWKLSVEVGGCGPADGAASDLRI
jgi:hypothetical protein